MRLSLNAIAVRLLLGSLIVLPLFLGASGYFLARSHQFSLEAAVRERLQLQIFTLLSQAEYRDAIRFDGDLIEARLGQPNSGLYASISDAAGARLWTSPSALTLNIDALNPGLPQLHSGQQSFRRQGDLFALSYQVLWETDPERSIPLVFSMFETTAAFDAERAMFRTRLLLWLGGAGLMLTISSLLIGAWGLRPLRRAAADIRAIGAGDLNRMGNGYPVEIRELTDNLNTLLDSEQQRRDRVRNTLSELAHSLKTPLTVIRSAAPDEPGFVELVNEQTTRMEQIVSWHLQRASAGSHHLLKQTPVRQTVERLCETMAKVYAGKQLIFAVDVDPDCGFRGDPRDLMELLGNLLDNASRFATTTVRIRARSDAQGLRIAIADDGPGIPVEQRSVIVQRGVRADTRHPGQGIGLAVAADICETCNGSLTIASADLGGAEIVLVFRQ